METGQIPRGVDAPDPLTEAAMELHDAMNDPAVPAARRRTYIRRFQQAWNDAGRTPALRVDGLYGEHTAAALARSTPVGTPAPAPEPRAPRTRTRTRTPEPEPAPARDEDGAPSWVRPSVALAKWTQQAIAADNTAARYLRALRANATYIAARTNTARTGVVVGQVPALPSDEQIAEWARAAWSRVQSEGASAVSALDSHAQGILNQAETALRNIRAQLDRETNQATREALQLMEGTLTAILRPLGRGIALATRPLAGPALLLGAGLLLLYVGSSSRRRAA